MNFFSLINYFFLLVSIGERACVALSVAIVTFVFEFDDSHALLWFNAFTTARNTLVLCIAFAISFVASFYVLQ